MPLVWLLRSLWPWSSRDLPNRYANFIAIAAFKTQKEIFEIVRGRYPLDTKFVILPMDLRGMQRGNPRQSIIEQHEELKKLAEEYPNQVIPFIHIDPRSGSTLAGPKPLDFIERFHRDGFKGIKLYPPLGYDAADPIVMPIYEFANEHNLPIMTHCSRGGVKGKNFDDQHIEVTTAPHRYRSVLDKFKKLRLCLAHFGGGSEWESYLNKNWIDDSTPLEKMDWLSQISTMIKSGNYPNLFTDISYTIFKFERYTPVLKVFLSDQRIQDKTLFGSDYYMIEQEKFSERQLSLRLRAELGEALFWKTAHDNPLKYLNG